MFGTRQIDSFELGDKLREAERAGVTVPSLGFSQYYPTYLRTDGEVEIYRAGERGEVRVGPGEVIDSHGNVVNLARLEQERINALYRSLSTLPTQEK